MSSFQPAVLPDKMNPGTLRYELGPVVLRRNVLSRGEARAEISEGQTQILVRNLLIYFPGYVEYSKIKDVLWPEGSPPEWHKNCVKRIIVQCRERLPIVGLRIVNKSTVGYRVEFIPGWRE